MVRWVDEVLASVNGWREGVEGQRAEARVVDTEALGIDEGRVRVVVLEVEDEGRDTLLLQVGDDRLGRLSLA
jgi:hypothetical protein